MKGETFLLIGYNIEIMVSGLKILMIEDDIEIGTWTKNKIEKITTIDAFTWVTSINDAMQYLKKELPEYIILDLQLPDGNGIEILKKIRKDNLTIKVFVFSINIGAKNACLRLGVDAFFDKMNDAEKLIQSFKQPEA